ncbi:MAG: hypothetical protein ACM33U_06250 [Solirubrobacterales bacterium]
MPPRWAPCCTDSGQSATDLLDQKPPDQANGSVPIVLQADTSLAQGQNKQAVDGL